MRFLLIAVSLLMASVSQAAVCKKWSAPEKISTLETDYVNEASGLALSKKFPNRFYHNNDSGDGGFFYITDLLGKNTQKIHIPFMTATDVEDIAVGPCSAGQCVFVADIGDNMKARKVTEVWMVPEVENFVVTANGAKKITLQYPDGPHDAESMAVHPITGDLYILTKEADYQVARLAYPAKLFKVSAQAMATADVAPLTMELLGQIDLPWINYDFGLFGQIATSMDISPDGSRMIVLTYETAVEFNMSLFDQAFQTRTWKETVDYKRADLSGLASQIEAISYAADGKSFYFDSEFNPDYGDTEAPLYKVNCLE